MIYFIRTGVTEYHTIREDRGEDALETLAEHLFCLWGEEEGKKLLATAEIIDVWADEQMGYMGTFYAVPLDEDEGAPIKFIEAPSRII